MGRAGGMAWASVRGLADRLRRRPAAAPTPGPTIVEGTYVRDYEVLDCYPGTARDTFEVTRWIDGSRGPSDVLAVVPVDGAILTQIYLPIDPARGLAFLNHTYDNLPLGPDTIKIQPGDPLRYEATGIVDIPGRVVVIGGVLANNYYHGLLNWFTRFTIVERLAPELYDDPDVRFLLDVQARDEPFLSILKAMDVPFDRVVWCDHKIDHRIEHAYLPSFLHEGLLCPEIFGLLAARIRRVLGIAVPAKPWRRVWIDRESAPPPRRRIDNFDEIAPMLDAYGFERIALERLSFAEQVRLFTETAIVAGSHGAGFSNIVFATPGCRALIVEKDFTRYLGIANLFRNLALTMGCPCELVPADSVFRDDIDYGVFINRHFADARVDVAAFADALTRTVRAADGIATPTLS